MDFFNQKEEKALSASCSIFSVYLVLYRYRSSHLAKHLIDEEGHFLADRVKDLITTLQNSSGLETHQKQIILTLEKLASSPYLQKKITQFDLPISPEFEKYVRLSMHLTVEPLTKTILRQAVLQCAFSYLRQTVGSCFATAPCLYILKRHLEYFFEDLYLLSKKSCLERLSSGHLIAVPMALSMGEHFLHTPIQESFLNDSALAYFLEHKALSNPLVVGKTFGECLGKELSLELYALGYDPLLKIWEYTVASFCDAKGEFSESTLYLTLGLDAKMPEGLGEFFYNSFQKQLEAKHLLSLQAQDEAYLAQQRLIMAEGMAKNATNEASFHRSKSEIIAASYQLHTRRLDMEDAKKEEEKIKHLYERKMHILKETIPQFFQESYDPDLVSMKSYSEDAPAGFRLFVKDGRLNSRFKAINTEDEFIQALKQFFETIERDLLAGNIDKDNQSIVTNVITETIQFSSSKKFLEKTYARAQKRHPKALPWAYVSGGTLETLLKTYFRKEVLKIQKIKGDTLALFFIQLIDYFKSLPETHLEPFRQDPYLSLLLETKHHACQLMPGLPMLRSLWESSGFTYTEMRDKIIEVGKRFYQNHEQTLIPGSFFHKRGKSYPTQTVSAFLQAQANKKEALFLATSFLLCLVDKQMQEATCGFCIIGDTNWTYNAFIIGYNPLTDNLALFAQDPETLGLLHLDNMEQFPLEWKIYEDLSRLELFVPGIKI